MDQQTQPSQPIQPTQPVQVTPTPAVQVTDVKPGGHKKQITLIVAVGIVILFLLAGVYYITQVMNRTKRMDAINITPKPTQILYLSPTPIWSSEENDINSVDTGNPDSDIADLQKDLNTFNQ
jgi:hypothetical protein